MRQPSAPTEDLARRGLRDRTSRDSGRPERLLAQIGIDRHPDRDEAEGAPAGAIVEVGGR